MAKPGERRRFRSADRRSWAIESGRMMMSRRECMARQLQGQKEKGGPEDPPLNLELEGPRPEQEYEPQLDLQPPIYWRRQPPLSRPLSLRSGC